MHFGAIVDENCDLKKKDDFNVQRALDRHRS